MSSELLKIQWLFLISNFSKAKLCPTVEIIIISMKVNPEKLIHFKHFAFWQTKGKINQIRVRKTHRNYFSQYEKLQFIIGLVVYERLSHRK